MNATRESGTYNGVAGMGPRSVTMRQLGTLPLLALGFLALVLPTGAHAANLHPLQTEHYNIHTDLEGELARDLGLRMDAMYTEYSRRLADFTNGAVPRMEVFLFSKQEDYLQFTGDR